MIDHTTAERAKFEAAYRAKFETAAALQPGIFEIDEFGDYLLAKVFVAFEMWKIGRSTLPMACPTTPAALLISRVFAQFCKDACLPGDDRISESFIKAAGALMGAVQAVEITSSLEGIREALLDTSISRTRDQSGWLYHSALPECDERTRVDKLLEAFNIEHAFVSMESDAPDFYERWCDDALDDCSTWTPEPPEGTGWILFEIYDTEDGPCALFGRDWYAAEKERKSADRVKRRAEQLALRDAAQSEPATRAVPVAISNEAREDATHELIQAESRLADLQKALDATYPKDAGEKDRWRAAGHFHRINSAILSATLSIQDARALIAAPTPDAERHVANHAGELVIPEGCALVKVSAQGVQFGNAWYSHEKITGYTAEQLNEGNCRVTGRAYMQWLAAPAQPTDKVPT